MAAVAPAASQRSTSLLRGRDWYVQEWLLLLFAVGMLVFLYLVAQHEARLQRSEIVRDAALVEQAIARQLEAQHAFFDRLALDLGAGRLSLAQFDNLAGKRVVEARVISEVLLIDADMNVVRHAPAKRALEDILLARAPYAEQMRLMAFTQKTGRGTYSDPYRSPTGHWLIEYATPLFEGERFAGMIVLLIELEKLLENALSASVAGNYHALLTTASGDDILEGSAAALEETRLSHTIPLSVPWRELRLTLYGSAPDSLLPNLTLSAAVIALTGLMVWTVTNLRAQQRMRRAAEAERDRVFSQSLASLRETNERFETVLDSLDVAVVVSDVERDEILFCNSRFRETFPGFGVGASMLDIERGFSDDGKPRLRVPKAPAATGAGGPVQVEERHHRPSNRWFLTRTRQIAWVDGRAAWLITLGDVTDRVLAERIRKTQEEKLMRTSRLMTVGEIASTLAHELNQPLAAIANYVSGCLRRLRLDGSIDEQVVRAMEKAEGQVQRAGAIIGRVREFVRTREPNRRPCDLNELVTSVGRLMESDDPERMLRCDLELDPTLPRAFADQLMIEQVLLNLLRNAREAMAHLPLEQRIATVRTRRLDDNRLCVEVSDRGIGISDEAEQQLFSPFFTTKAEGMGMGLNICRSLIEYHGGSLTFRRNQDAGATFQFTLPPAEDLP
ncbi:MAG: ATP-binding protein [Casimicrobiaceae bacterium]|nr:ATP-binding protein [Casimicrobiaceae bacterium]